MLQVWLLGQFEVKFDGRRVVLPARAAQSLLAYLMLTAGTPHRREKLAGLLWSEFPDENARRNLRHELWRIRKALVTPNAPDAEYILADELTLTFNPQAEYWLDAVQFQRDDNGLDSFISNLALYRGELLPGMYDDWVSLERERLQAVFDTKMQTLLEKLIDAQRWSTVIEWSERWIAQGQTPEPAYRALMLAHAAMGNRAQVAATLERCKTDLHRELAVEPSPETNKLYQEIMVGQVVSNVDLTPMYHARVQLPVLDEMPAPGEPPFKGLEFFDEQDAALFFGREELTKKLVRELRANQFLAVVVGASGSGKSSLVRAGVVPALRNLTPSPSPDTGEGSKWQIFVLTPTAHPLEALAMALTRNSESVTATATLMDDLARNPRSLYLYLRRVTNDERRTETQSSSLIPHPLLVVDQFEELFTLCRDEFEREAVIDNLLTALAYGNDAHLTIMLTLRADFYAHLAQYPELRDAVAKHQEFIGPMTGEELRRAIEEPAKKSGWAFEPGLVDLILRDVGSDRLGQPEPGALPLLSHALLETWKRRSGHTLTHKGYQDAGGVRGAIAQTAESVYQQFTPDEQNIARDIFLRLTEPGEGTEDTRRRATFDELVPRDENAATVRAVLTRIADARLVTLHQDTADVAHEALIREWHRLSEWLNQDREGLRLHRQITDAANEWQMLERDAGALYRGARLMQAREFAEQNPYALNEGEREFLQASDENEKREAREREEQQQRELLAAQTLAETQARAAKQLRRRAMFLAGAFVVAALLAVVALFLNNQSQANAREAIAQANAAEQAHADADKASRIATARELAANAIGNLNVDAERSVLLALEAVKATAADNLVLPEAIDALHRAIVGLRVERVFPTANGAYSAAFTPDGKQVLIASFGNTKRYDVATGELLGKYDTSPETWDYIHISPDGNKLALFDYEGQDASHPALLKVFDFKSGALEQTTQLPVKWQETGVECFDPQWKRLAYPYHPDNSLRIADFATGKTLVTLSGHQDNVRECLFSPDGKKTVTISNDRTAKVWDSETGKELYTISEGTAGITRMAFSPDSKKIAGGNFEGLARIWDAETGQLLQTLRGSTNNVFPIDWSPDGKFVVTSGFDPRLIVWDAEAGNPILFIPAHTDFITDVHFSPDGKRIVSASKDGTAKIWDLSLSHEERVIETGPQMRLATDAQNTRFAMSGYDGEISVWDMASGTPIFKLPNANDLVFSDYQVALSPDGTLVAAQRSDNTIGIWDIASQKQIASFDGAPDEAIVFGFSPDGKHFAATIQPGIQGRDIDEDKLQAVVWDIASGQELAAFKVKNVLGAKFTPDGARLVTLVFDGTVTMWDIATQKKIWEQTPHTSFIWDATFSPDGKRMATASRDRTVKILDVETGKELLALSGFGGTVFRAVYSPDGKTIATTDCDAKAKLWDAETGQKLQTLYADICLYWAAFSPDGKRLITSSDDSGVREYVLDINDLVALAQKRLTRTWTRDECQTFLHVEKCP